MQCQNLVRKRVKKHILVSKLTHTEKAWRDCRQENRENVKRNYMDHDETANNNFCREMLDQFAGISLNCKTFLSFFRFYLFLSVEDITREE